MSVDQVLYYHKDDIGGVTYKIYEAHVKVGVTLEKMYSTPGKKSVLLDVSYREFWNNYIEVKDSPDNIIEAIRKSKVTKQVNAPMIDKKFNNFKERKD